MQEIQTAQPETRTAEQEAAEDLFFGQVVIIWARWFLILAGAILILWTTTDASALVVSILPILALMAMNFFLHGRYLVERPANQMLLLAASALDLGADLLGATIALLVLVSGRRLLALLSRRILARIQSKVES